MGLVQSRADTSAATAPPPMPVFAGIGAAAAAALKAEKPSYLELPPPVKYEEIQREVLMTLKPDSFEGFRFEINKPLNPNFYLSHNMLLGNIDLSTGGKQVLKTTLGTYEFGATVATEKLLMLGRITADGRLSGRLKYDLTNSVAVKVHTQLSSEPGQSQMMVDTDVKGADWNAQLKLGSPAFVGANYFQSVTPRLSAGGEFFWLQGNLKSGVGAAMRHTGEKHIATLQVATTGILSLQYAHKVSEKVTLATDLLWQWGNREATAQIGYDATLRQCRVRGNINSNGVISAYLEERFSPGINFVMSAEIDHWHGNYKFGYGVVAGE